MFARRETFLSEHAVEFSADRQKLLSAGNTGTPRELVDFKRQILKLQKEHANINLARNYFEISHIFFLVCPTQAFLTMDFKKYYQNSVR
jgi:hypothetical protein